MKCKKSRLFERFLEFLNEEFAGKLAKTKRPDLRESLDILSRALPIRLAENCYHPDPPRFLSLKRGGKSRQVALYGVPDRLVLSALFQAARERTADRFRPECLGGLRGRSRFGVVAVLDAAAREGRHWALVTDVEQFFSSVDREILRRCLSRLRVPADVLDLMMAFVATAAPGGKGIPLGNPLSKLCGNAYLHPLDQELAARGMTFCRYVDDILVMTAKREQAEQALRLIQETLKERLGLKLSERKTGIYHRFTRGFDFLGFSIAGRSMGPSDENVLRFEERIRDFQGRRWRLAGAVRRWNRTIHNFGHMYKTLAVRKLFHRLDRLVRSAFRSYLRNRGAPDLRSDFQSPWRFPPNLAFRTRMLRELGLASLVEIKSRHESKKPDHERAGGPEPEAPRIPAVPRGLELVVAIRLNQGRMALGHAELRLPLGAA